MTDPSPLERILPTPEAKLAALGLFAFAVGVFLYAAVSG